MGKTKILILKGKIEIENKEKEIIIGFLTYRYKECDS